jgi:hypothetical protein
VTKDEDFADMVATGREAPTVVWVRIGNARRAALLAWFEPLIDRIVEMVDVGDPGVEVGQALGDVVEPVLFVIPEGVDGPQRAGLVLGHLEARNLTGLVDCRLEPDAAARLLSKTFAPSWTSAALRSISNAC